jgi:hypothetical protein
MKAVVADSFAFGFVFLSLPLLPPSLSFRHFSFSFSHSGFWSSFPPPSSQQSSFRWPGLPQL